MKLWVLISAVFAATLLSGCGLINSDPIEVTISVYPDTTDEKMVIFDGDYEAAEIPDQLGVTSLPDQGGVRLKWPIDGNNRALSLAFKFETLDVSEASALHISFESEDRGIRLDNITLSSDDGSEWKHVPGQLVSSIELPTEGFELDLINVPIRLRATLTGIEINLHSLFNDSELVLEEVWISM